MCCIHSLTLAYVRCTLLASILVLFSFMMADASPVNTAHLLAEYQQQHPVNEEQLNKKLQQQIRQFEQRRINTAAIQPPSNVSVTPYPIISSELTPGKVKRRKASLRITTPLFLIGFDPLSIQWLKHYGHRLQQLKATGFVVNVNTLQQLNTLRKSAPQLRLIPLPANDLAKQLHIHHYPVLLSRHLIEQ